MISIIFDKENKKLAIQISKKFQTNGITTLLNEFSDNEDTTNEDVVDTAILILSKNSNFSEKIIKYYDTAFNKQLTIIPFIVSDISLSVAMQHFLNTHDWINAYDVSTNEAIDDLAILCNEIVNDSQDTNKSSISSVQKKDSNAKNNKQTYAIIAVAAVFIVMHIKRYDCWKLANGKLSRQYATFAR